MCSTIARESGFPFSSENTDDLEWEGHILDNEVTQCLLPGSCLSMEFPGLRNHVVFLGHLVIRYSLVSICYACGSGMDDTNTVFA